MTTQNKPAQGQQELHVAVDKALLQVANNAGAIIKTAAEFGIDPKELCEKFKKVFNANTEKYASLNRDALQNRGGNAPELNHGQNPSTRRP